MTNKLELPAATLLEKFGKGSHVPGSGSAAAFQGMLSAQLILTVISLTIDKKRGKLYQSIIPEISKISSEIKNRIYPRLQFLFHQDSEQFNIAIELRDARDKEDNFLRGKILSQQAKDALKPATETLVEIAELCTELADYAIFIFNNAFKTARGDSGVALHTAVSTIAGCLSIINLNLLSINDSTWIESINLTSRSLKKGHERLLSSAQECQELLENEVNEHQLLLREIRSLETIKQGNTKLSDSNIEDVAKKLQNIMWRYRNTIWKRRSFESPREILQPQVAFEKLLNYTVFKRERLNPYKMFGETVEIAGIIDSSKEAVVVSTIFPVQTQNFTLAHELGHALLHKQTVLHRDRATDGSSALMTRDRTEIQADKFATYFLMPEKQVRATFHELFFTETFSPNDETVFALTGGRLDSFLLRCRNLRELARIIASADSFYGTSFRSIANLFNVSEGAMAIRLEELGLVEFRSPVSVYN